MTRYVSAFLVVLGSTINSRLCQHFCLVGPSTPLMVLITLCLLLIGSPVALGSDERFVPQHIKTSLDPVSIIFHPLDQSIFMVLNRDGRIDLFDIHDLSAPNKFLEFYTAANHATFDATGKHILAVVRDGSIRLWNSTTGKLAREPIRHQQYPGLAAAFGSDGTTIVSIDEFGNVFSWNGESTTQLGPISEDPEAFISRLAISHDAKHIVASMSTGAMHVWSLVDEKYRKRKIEYVHQGLVLSIAIGPNGDYIVSGDNNGTIRLSNIKDNDKGSSLQVRGSPVTSLAFSTTGRRIVSGDSRGVVKLWYAHAAQPAIQTIQSHEGEVTSVAFSPNGNKLASASSYLGYGEVRFWDTEPYISSIEVEDFALDVAFVAGSADVVAGDDKGTIRKWDATTGIQNYQIHCCPVN